MRLLSASCIMKKHGLESLRTVDSKQSLWQISECHNRESTTPHSCIEPVFSFALRIMALIYTPEDWKSPSKTRNLNGRAAISLLLIEASSKAPHMMPFSTKTVPSRNQVCQAGYKNAHTCRQRHFKSPPEKLLRLKLHFQVW